jgi:hypothetical protein
VTLSPKPDIKLDYDNAFPIIGQIYFQTEPVLDLIESRYCGTRLYYFNETRIGLATADTKAQV